tara:strand:+ start:32685 stop:34229 length:1545 start_codon:yes stop_codon:yes gene_type:complete
MENEIILPEGYDNADINLVDELEKSTNVAYTANGAISNRTSLDALLDFFAQGGAMRYNSESEVFELFQKAFIQDNLLALKCLFYFRDIRGGQGERRLLRVVLKKLAKQHPELVVKNLENVVKYGRWDDLFCLEGTSPWFQASKFIQTQFNKDVASLASGEESVSLLGKWMPSVNASSATTKKLGKYFARFFGMQHSEYRKTLSKLRTAIDVVEKKMTTKQWDKINYERVPGKAGLKYRGAFSRNDTERYGKYLEDVASGKKTIKTQTLYPYDIVGKFIGDYGTKNNHSPADVAALDAMWKNLPNYLADKPHRGLVVCDTSGSMYGAYGSVAPIEVSVSLAMYIAERNDDPTFGNAFLTFSQCPQLQRIVDGNIYEKVSALSNADWGYNTNLQNVFNVILQTAKNKNLGNDNLPEKLYIVSDMQFDEACASNEDSNYTTIKKKFEAEGFKCPELIFWNVNACGTQVPVTVNDEGVCMVSGCSPAILTAVLSGETVDPIQVMLDAIDIDRYASVVV